MEAFRFHFHFQQKTKQKIAKIRFLDCTEANGGGGGTESTANNIFRRSLAHAVDQPHSAAEAESTLGASSGLLTEESVGGFPTLCLSISDIFIALALILLILATVFGNVLVVLSVFVYKRMRTFNNFLLMSLATADLLVGLLIMPLSLLDLLHNHSWPFGRVLCRIWATSDVLVCTASILNLVVISLDRYMAITSPLRYPRTRSRRLACGLLCFVWGMSLVVCSPPWFVRGWGIAFMPEGLQLGGGGLDHRGTGAISGGGKQKFSPLPPVPLAAMEESYTCAYPTSVSYRIYSACCSFYIPLIVMLFVYFKIFRVASERERMIVAGGTCRLSRRAEKTHLKGTAARRHHHQKEKASTKTKQQRLNNSTTTANSNSHNRCKSAPMDRNQSNNMSTGSRDPPSSARYCFSLHNNHSEDTIRNYCHRTITPVEIAPATLYRQDEEIDEEDEEELEKHRNSIAVNRPALVEEISDESQTPSRSPSRSSSARSDPRLLLHLSQSQQSFNTTSNHLNTGTATAGGRVVPGGGGMEASKSADCIRSLGSSSSTITAPALNNNNSNSNDERLQNQPNNNIRQNPQALNAEHRRSTGTTTTTSAATGTTQHTAVTNMSSGEGGAESQQNQSRATPTEAGKESAKENSIHNNGDIKQLKSMLPTATDLQKRRQSAVGCVGPIQIPRNALALQPQRQPAKRGGAKPMISKQSSVISNACVSAGASSIASFGGGASGRLRGSKEKIVYLRERKALKTIGIVVLGFIVCWMPFFIIYLLEVFIERRLSATYGFRLFSEFFLWLGYSNSVLNPIIYTMYNGDFRRCFRDLLAFGCWRQHRRTMSVKKLHQSTLF